MYKFLCVLSEKWGFSMPIGYLCQWISYAVFAVVSVCCVPVSHVDVLTHSFQLRQNFVLQVFDFYRLILHLLVWLKMIFMTGKTLRQMYVRYIQKRNIVVKELRDNYLILLWRIWSPKHTIPLSVLPVPSARCWLPSACGSWRVISVPLFWNSCWLHFASSVQ